MDAFLKIAAAVLLTAVASLTVTKREKEISLLLTVAVCCMTAAAGAAYLQPVLEFLRQLEETGNLDHQFLTILLKCAGIAMVTEMAVLICRDAGNEPLGKGLQLLSAAVILWLSLPLLSGLLTIILNIFGEI